MSDVANLIIPGIIFGIWGSILLVMISIFYVYYSLAWMVIARKMKYKSPWIVWIPFVKIAVILQLGGFHWAWVFLLFVPIFGWIALFVMGIIAKWKIYEKRKYPGWFSLAVIIPQLGPILQAIAVGFVAWADRKKKIKF
ncbi:hypothetical protein ACFLZX_06370 [Nanoarchaeota archaeon]